MQVPKAYLKNNSMNANIRPATSNCKLKSLTTALNKLGFLPVFSEDFNSLLHATLSLSPSVLDLWLFNTWYKSLCTNSCLRPLQNSGFTQLKDTDHILIQERLVGVADCATTISL